MTDTTYNGWTNYETWRVNLEIFDNIPLEDFENYQNLKEWEEPDAYELSKALQERAEYYIECSSEEGLARDYALAFLNAVNFYEIATHMIEEYVREHEQSNF